MNRGIIVTLLAGTFALAINPLVMAQTTPEISTPPSPSPGKGERSKANTGGQLRGLDRADQAAGQHGRQGRETARDAQINQQQHPERPGSSGHPGKPSRPGR